MPLQFPPGTPGAPIAKIPSRMQKSTIIFISGISPYNILDTTITEEYFCEDRTTEMNIGKQRNTKIKSYHFLKPLIFLRISKQRQE